MRKKLSLLLILILLFLASYAPAKASCPYGEVNCESQCGNFVDEDDNGLCDSSEAAAENLLGSKGNVGVATIAEEDIFFEEEMQGKTIAELATLYGIDVTEYINALEEYLDLKGIDPETTFDSLHNEHQLAPKVARDLALALQKGQIPGDESAPQSLQFVNQKSAQPGSREYYFDTILIVVLILYLSSYILARTKKISILLHRRIWNVVLGISFFFCALSGIILVLRVSYGLEINPQFDLLFLHVETGIIMALVATFYLIWHWSYFKGIFRRNHNSH